MSILSAVPTVVSSDLDGTEAFYVGFLGFELAASTSGFRGFVSADNEAVQLVAVEAGQHVHEAFSISVSDVDQLFADAIRKGHRIVYPLTDEPWGVRRFFVEDPNSVVVSVLSGHSSTG